MSKGAKGLSTVKEGISQCSSSHNLYEVRSLPRKEPVDFSPQQSRQWQLQQELLVKFRKSKKTRQVSKYIRYMLFALISPFYYALYWTPKWVINKKIKPVILKIRHAIEKTIHFCQNHLARINRRYTTIQTKINSFVDKKKASLQNIISQIKQLSQRSQKRIESIQTIIVNPVQTVKSNADKLTPKISHFHKKFKEFPAVTLQRVKPIVDSIRYYREYIIAIIRAFPMIVIQKIRAKVALPEKSAEQACVFPVDNTAKEPNAFEKFVQMQKKKTENYVQIKRKIFADRFYAFTAPVRNTVQKFVRYQTKKRTVLKNKLKAIQEYVLTRYYRSTHVFENFIKKAISPFQKAISPIKLYSKSLFHKIHRFTSEKNQKVNNYIAKKLEPIQNAAKTNMNYSQKAAKNIIKKSVERVTRPFKLMQEAMLNRLRLPAAFFCVIPQCSFEVFKEAFQQLEFLP